MQIVKVHMNDSYFWAIAGKQSLLWQTVLCIFISRRKLIIEIEDIGIQKLLTTRLCKSNSFLILKFLTNNKNFKFSIKRQDLLPVLCGMQ